MGRYTTLGSLFDGIGGFPLGAIRVGITPIWASEIEAAPISITRRHFPEMRHLGDITKINGAEIEPVDIISFGSPCQDLSIAGRRAGLEGGRSSLFMQAIRIIREMRKATNGIYPARIVWENVPGAFTTHKGRDFQKVIEEIARIAEPELSIPRPAKRGGWLASGAVLGDSWSLAWRTLDSQYWGVPQRRRRIFLVMDFGTRCAGEILFKPEGETGDFEKGGTTGIANTGNVEKRVEQYVLDYGHSSSRIQINPEIAVTLKASSGGCGAKTGLYFLPTYCIVGNTIDRSYKSGGNGIGISEEIGYTLNTIDRHAVTVPFIRNAFGGYIQGDIGKTLLARDDITSGDLIASYYSVRRLTPLECERLQGYPDGWTETGHDGKRISDNQRYKALGNSLAIPCAVFVLSRVKN